LARLAWAGPVDLRRRRGLDLWYGERRPDPGATAEHGSAPDAGRAIG
jgi:hypothetical protein